MKRRLLGVVAAIAAASFFAAAAASWLLLRASLPALDGEARLADLASRVTIERDEAGVPTISAENREDLARALGYLHGQDRFFQMDLLRRAAAGELSALLGPSLLPADRVLRLHRFRDVARSAVAGLDARSRSLLDAYVAGVNSGLSSLRSRPFEYWLLSSRPQPWRAEDTALCVHAMFLQLQDSVGHRQLQKGLLRATLPPDVWRFLEAGAPEWDAAIDGSTSEAPRIPDASAYDLRALGDLPLRPPEEVVRHLDYLGSNNWAVAGSRTTNGAAVLANDLHLNLRVPNIWYRARLVQTSGREAFEATGVTLPGTPSIVAGSNGHIAWGFTDSYGEFARVIRLAPVVSDAEAYATAQGPQHYRYVDEAIEVKGAPTGHLKVALTPWGPVVGKDWEGRPYALEWTAHDPGAVNLALLELEGTHSAVEAIHAASGFGIPAQNFLVADADGHIGWTIAGRLPRRGAAAPGVPQLSTDASVGFDGWESPEEQPRLIDPAAGLLWSANARVVGGADALAIGDDGMDRGARAAQIRQDLELTRRPFTPLASLAIQLDDRALFLERWRSLLGAVIERARSRGDHGQDAAHEVLARWSGHASPDDPAYRLVHAFRAEVEARVFYMLIAPARREAKNFRFDVPTSFEGPLWRLLEAQPTHLLAAEYPDWDAFLREALIASEKLPAGCSELESCTWGAVNTVRVAHPLSAALPLLSRFLDMPAVRLAGGRHDMPRIQGPDYGASERFSVAPGHENEGYFHMPGGQSGHPLSPFYRTGFAAWAEGRPAPFLPGAPAHVLHLTR
ncbi:MAG TPA: penicillin acylase family protein [Steroidobacteraceae bacterium]|nr:penicillin acylase family protein [Steroidobacteraceae bacterium]